MMQKKLLRVLALVALIIISAVAWKITHPTLTPEQQIELALDNAESALENRSVGGVVSVLYEKFSHSGTSRKEIADDVFYSHTSRQEVADALRGAFFQWRDVKLQRTNTSIYVEGTVASTRGDYVLTYRPNLDAPLETQRGTYHLDWVFTSRKQWKVSNVAVKPEKGDFSIAN